MTDKQIKQIRQALVDQISASGITHQELADKCGFHRSSVTRMLGANYAPTLDNFIKICDAAGLKLNLEAK